jgi:hypothetical protein
MPRPHAAAIAVALAASLLGGCATTGRAAAPLPAVPAAHGYSKVLVVVEENKTYDEVLGSGRAPYLDSLAGTYGTATSLDAGYPTQCPSLAAYIVLTSGDTHGICDDNAPAAHPLPGDSIFGQVAASGREWRVYAESMPAPCSLKNSADNLYAVRHTAATYYTEIRDQCAKRVVPMGTIGKGAFHDGLAAGLPALSLLVPDMCNDMHGESACHGDDVRNGDDWLHSVLPEVMASPDYTSGRLAVVITWDEGSPNDNHIPTLVISPTTLHRKVDAPTSQCSVLALMSEVLAVKPLGCAADAPGLAAAFGL